MILGSERCDWMRSDAQVGCLVCALPREHTNLPESRAKPRQRRAERARNARFRRATDPSGRGTAATGRLDKETALT